MSICFLCKTDHKMNCFDCDKIVSIFILNYKKMKIENLKDEILVLKKNKNKKYKCENCCIYLSSLANFRNHTVSLKCKKMQSEYKCEKCGSKFASKQNLLYHQTHNVCGFSDNKDINNLINPESNINNTSNTNNNINTTNNLNNSNNTANTANNIQNNIQINVNPDPVPVEMVPFRDVSYKIPTKKYLEYANNPDQAVKQFVKDYHLNPNKPERMNVLNTNRRDNRVQLFDFDEDFI